MRTCAERAHAARPPKHEMQAAASTDIIRHVCPKKELQLHTQRHKNIDASVSLYLGCRLLDDDNMHRRRLCI